MKLKRLLNRNNCQKKGNWKKCKKIKQEFKLLKPKKIKKTKKIKNLKENNKVNFPMKISFLFLYWRNL
jgi:hypothetical protein